MTPRATLVASLVLVEAVLAGTMLMVVRSDDPLPWTTGFAGDASAGPNLPEGGPHRTFRAGARPTLTVDIGLADLTIVAGKPGQFDVSVSKSEAFGPFRSTAPIAARQDGDGVRIAAAETRWRVGDNRMVTVVLPPDTRVNVLNGGDIKATGLRAEARFHSNGRGSITIDDYNAPALHVASSNDLALHDIVSPRIEASSNDRIQATGLHVHDGNLTSDDGRVSVEIPADADTLVTAEASRGGVHVAGAATVPNPAPTDGDGDPALRTIRIGTARGHLSVQGGTIYLTAR